MTYYQRKARRERAKGWAFKAGAVALGVLALVAMWHGIATWAAALVCAAMFFELLARMAFEDANIYRRKSRWN